MNRTAAQPLTHPTHACFYNATSFRTEYRMDLSEDQVNGKYCEIKQFCSISISSDPNSSKDLALQVG